MKHTQRQNAQKLSFDKEKARIIQKKCLHFLENFFEKNGVKTVGSYSPMGHEIPCDILEKFLEEKGQKLYHPQWAKEGKPFIEYPNIIPDIVLIPALAFDQKGYRLGRGGGSFDRYLAQHPHIFKIGLAFSSQIVNDIGAETHDIPMDIVITEDFNPL